jgi:hypothetical protein
MEEVVIPFPRPDKTPPVTMTYFTSNHGIAPSGGSDINFVSRPSQMCDLDRWRASPPIVPRKRFIRRPLGFWP